MAFGYADVRLDFITRADAEGSPDEERRFDEWFSREVEEVRALAEEESVRKTLTELTRLVDSLSDVPTAVRDRIALALGEFARDHSL